jgi:hypothetical protein
MLGEAVTYRAAAEVTVAGAEPLAGDAARPYRSHPSLPFNPTDVAKTLREERYVRQSNGNRSKGLQRRMYYALRPMLSTSVRRHLQRLSLRGWQREAFPRWPVDLSVDRMHHRMMALAARTSPTGKVPFIWFWPDGHSAAAVMTHDVETATGMRSVGRLMDLDASFGIPASFQIIPAGRYRVTASALSAIRSRRFEVNVHDLKHDGHLFEDLESFKKAAARINYFAEDFGALGFRSAVLYRKQEWFRYLRVAYDMSVPNVGRLDPQHGGCCTVMPYFIGDILELPVTATQDYSLFHILRTLSLDLWREQMTMIRNAHGLMNFIVHPDYLDTKARIDCYRCLLGELARLRTEANVWVALPRDVNQWWRQRNAMTLVKDGNRWSVRGEGAERARVMYARDEGGEVVYSAD